MNEKENEQYSTTRPGVFYLLIVLGWFIILAKLAGIVTVTWLAIWHYYLILLAYECAVWLAAAITAGILGLIRGGK